jgi:acyl carrier protein
VSELDVRLSALFLAAFPCLKDKSVSNATRDSISEWDSIAAVTLVTLVEEEFGEQFDLEDAAEWTSYKQIRDLLQERLGG